MPNWCYNELTLSVRKDIPETQRSLAVLKAFEYENPFQMIHPCPPELDSDGAHTYGGKDKKKYDRIRADLKEKYGYDNGYDWRVSNWGTKWDVDVDVLDPMQDDGTFISISVCFDSAWSPPEQLYRYINQEYPEIEISCTAEEGGVGFQVEGYFFQDSIRWDVSDFMYENEEEAKPTTNVGSSTVLPLP